MESRLSWRKNGASQRHYLIIPGRVIIETKTMFENLNALPPDPILGLIAAYAADPNPKKIDLGIGVYRDKHGNTPMLDCVIEAEKRLITTQTTKTYLGPPGVAGFNSAITDVIFGAFLNSDFVRVIFSPSERQKNL